MLHVLCSSACCLFSTPGPEGEMSDHERIHELISSLHNAAHGKQVVICSTNVAPMHGWIREKSGLLLESLCSIGEELGRLEPETSDRLVDDFTYAMTYALKLFAFSEGRYDDDPDWATGVLGERTQELGFLVKHGLLPASSLDYVPQHVRRIAEERRRLISNIRELLVVGMRSPNRTLIHELLNALSDNDRIWLRGFDEKLELVSAGQLTWADFLEKSLSLLGKLELQLVPSA